MKESVAHKIHEFSAAFSGILTVFGSYLLHGKILHRCKCRQNDQAMEEKELKKRWELGEQRRRRERWQRIEL